MADLNSRIQALATIIGTTNKEISDRIGALDDLTTSSKDSIVAAVNAAQAYAESIAETVGTLINDETASLTTVYSSSKVSDLLTEAKNAVKDDLLGDAGEAYDTLKELADLITENESAIDALETLAAGHVRYDAAQTLTEDQQTQARSNIGALGTAETAAAAVADAAGNVITDTYATKSENETTAEAAAAAQATADALATAVGDTDTDFEALYLAAYEGTTTESE